MKTFINEKTIQEGMNAFIGEKISREWVDSADPEKKLRTFTAQVAFIEGVIFAANQILSHLDPKNIADVQMAANAAATYSADLIAEGCEMRGVVRSFIGQGKSTH